MDRVIEGREALDSHDVQKELELEEVQRRYELLNEKKLILFTDNSSIRQLLQIVRPKADKKSEGR